MIKGLFEIHITVDHLADGGFYNLFNYVSKQGAQGAMKLIFAVAKEGIHRDQYMISKFKNGTIEEVINRADQIKKEMEDMGISILRVKVESMAFNEGVPVTEIDYTNFLNTTKTGKPYFEFHAKLKVDSLEKIEKIIEEIRTGYYDLISVKVALSYNILGSKLPLLTIRIYNHGRNIALYHKDKILDQIKGYGYHITDAIQQEFSVYDTNDEFDKGWLI